VPVAFSRITLRSYAKINLGLHVLGKRSDGYHEVRTALQTVGLHDRLTIQRTTRQQKIRFQSNSPELDPADNLVVRAIQLFQQRTKTPGGFGVSLEKRIPLGSGLGGGSSNAAVTLLGLCRLFGLKLPKGDLLEWSGLLGSDVPFFLLGGTALGIGRGSEVYPLEEPPRKRILLAIPPRGVPTRDAYERLSLRLTKRIGASMIPVFCSGYLDSLNGGRAQENDFEEMFFEESPQIRKLKDDWLKCGAEAAGLTGSGSALFGIFSCEKTLLRAVAATSWEALRLIRTHTLNRLRYQKGIVEFLG
jgi:4-diphosphocytidyl-2-C-methyl-D-erythritol kinase